MVCLCGGMVSLVILFAVFRGDGHPMYEAMAREKDAPHRTRYIIIPYLTTLAGGLATNIWFPTYAIAGYLVAGIGDGVGEVVGTRFGRNQYSVPSFTRVRAKRTIEGSVGVLIASVAAVSLAVFEIQRHSDVALESSVELFWIVPTTALASCIAEAISPHGWDNLTMQVIPTLLLAGLMS